MLLRFVFASHHLSVRMALRPTNTVLHAARNWNMAIARRTVDADEFPDTAVGDGCSSLPSRVSVYIVRILLGRSVSATATSGLVGTDLCVTFYVRLEELCFPSCCVSQGDLAMRIRLRDSAQVRSVNSGYMNIECNEDLRTWQSSYHPSLSPSNATTRRLLSQPASQPADRRLWLCRPP
jgi:hypothetical protein